MQDQIQNPSSIDNPADSDADVQDAKQDPVQRLVTQGREYYKKGELQAALACFQNAYDTGSAAGRSALVAEIANDMGVVYIVLRQWKQAEKWLSEAQRLFINLQDYDGEAQTLGNVGSMHRAQGNLSEAAAHFQLAADRFQLVGDDDRRSVTLRSLGMVRLRQLRFMQALVAFEASLACKPNARPIHRLLRRLVSLPLRLMQR